MSTANISGTELYFEQLGSGPGLLFLNGTGATVANASPLLTVFAAAFDVVAFDQRGIGRSALPDGPYTMADLAADVLALADHLGWEHFRLAGVSFGGMVAQEVAVTASDRIDRLVLLCTSPGGAGGASFPLHTLAEMDPADRDASSVQILDSRFTPDWLESHDGDRALASLMVQRFTMDKPESVRKGEELQLGARRGHDVYGRLPRITCPTMVAQVATTASLQWPTVKQ